MRLFQWLGTGRGEPHPATGNDGVVPVILQP